jgi:hypothetical protein
MSSTGSGHVEHLASVERLMVAVRASHNGDEAATLAALRDVPSEAWLLGLMALTESAIEFAARTAGTSWETSADVVQTTLLDALLDGDDPKVNQ